MKDAKKKIERKNEGNKEIKMKVNTQKKERKNAKERKRETTTKGKKGDKERRT